MGNQQEAMHWIAPSEKDTAAASLKKRLWIQLYFPRAQRLEPASLSLCLLL